MRREPGADHDVDLTEPDEVVAAMAIAVERLRELAAAAFNAAAMDSAKARAAP